VLDALFQESDFFDRRDLVQVKYEMLRRVRKDGQSIAEASRSFGFSRVAFYQASLAFQQGGLPGLVRKRPGPRGAHKLSETVMRFIEEHLGANATLEARELTRMVRKKFGLSIHPRSIERALSKRAKKGR
jgi:transposase